MAFFWKARFYLGTSLQKQPPHIGRLSRKPSDVRRLFSQAIWGLNHWSLQTTCLATHPHPHPVLLHPLPQQHQQTKPGNQYPVLLRCFHVKGADWSEES